MAWPAASKCVINLGSGELRLPGLLVEEQSQQSLMKQERLRGEFDAIAEVCTLLFFVGDGTQRITVNSDFRIPRPVPLVSSMLIILPAVNSLEWGRPNTSGIKTAGTGAVFLPPELCAKLESRVRSVGLNLP